MGKNMDMAYSLKATAATMLVHSRMVSKMGREHSLTVKVNSRVISMRENSRMIKNMGKAYTLLPVETSIQVNSGMV